MSFVIADKSRAGRRARGCQIAAAAILLTSLLFADDVFAGGNAAHGKAAVERYGCASCHGADFNHPVDASWPKLAGQHPDYLAVTLKAYQRGSGDGARKNTVMANQAAPLSEEDIENIAAYLSRLKGDLILRK